MQQSSTTIKNQDVGCRRLLRALTPLRSAFLYLQFLTWCHPYILLHFLKDFYTCFTNICAGLALTVNIVARSEKNITHTHTYTHA